MSAYDHHKQFCEDFIAAMKSRPPTPIDPIAELTRVSHWCEHAIKRAETAEAELAASRAHVAGMKLFLETTEAELAKALEVLARFTPIVKAASCARAAQAEYSGHLAHLRQREQELAEHAEITHAVLAAKESKP
jgi:hypothetical protein